MERAEAKKFRAAVLERGVAVSLTAAFPGSETKWCGQLLNEAAKLRDEAKSISQQVYEIAPKGRNARGTK